METSEQIVSLLARKLSNITDYAIEPFYKQEEDRVPYVLPYSAAKIKEIKNILNSVGWWGTPDVTPPGALLDGSFQALKGSISLTVSIVGFGGPTVLSANGSALISDNDDSRIVPAIYILVKGWTLTENPTLAEVLGHPLLGE